MKPKLVQKPPPPMYEEPSRSAIMLAVLMIATAFLAFWGTVALLVYLGFR